MFEIALQHLMPELGGHDQLFVEILQLRLRGMSPKDRTGLSSKMLASV
jgi:hypothetical protein